MKTVKISDESYQLLFERGRSQKCSFPEGVCKNDLRGAGILVTVVNLKTEATSTATMKKAGKSSAALHA